MLVGGRVSAEDAYAYGKFARSVLDTNDIDFRARPHSAEEADFLASSVVATGPEGGAVTYADLERAKAVVLVGFEPEEESPIVFLRLRKAVRKHKTAVYAVAPFATRGLDKLAGHADRRRPRHRGRGAEALASDGVTGHDGAARAAEALKAGTRSSSSASGSPRCPAPCPPPRRWPTSTGARLAWVPRRAGERGALEAGALPGAAARRPPGLRRRRPPAGRRGLGRRRACRTPPAATPPASSRLRRPGRSTPSSSAASTPPTWPTPAREEALAKTFVVSLELRASSVTEVADVVLPVAPHAEKGGTFVNWEGRVRPFQAALDSNAQSDYRVLDMLASELGAFLGTRTLAEVRAEMTALGPWTGERVERPDRGRGRRAERRRRASSSSRPGTTCSTEGRLQDGEPFLAGTAARTVRPRVRRARPRPSASLDGELVTVSTGAGSVTAPVVVEPGMVDHVVWLPTNSTGCHVRSGLGVDAGAVVTITKGGVA